MEFILGALCGVLFTLIIKSLDRRNHQKWPSGYVLTGEQRKKLAEVQIKPRSSETVPAAHGKTVKVFVPELSHTVDVSEEIVNQEGIVRLLLPNPEKNQTMENVDFANLKPGYILTPFRIRRNDDGVLEAVRIA